MCNFEPDDDLYRGICPEWWSDTDDRPTSAAFRDYELSVDWCKYSSPIESLERFKRLFCLSNVALASIRIQDAENLKQRIIYDPCKIKGEYNSAHTLVKGKKTKSIARKFAREYAKVIFRLEKSFDL